MSERKVTASLSVRMWLDCPHCDEQLDLMDIDELNDESGMWGVIKSNEWDDLGYVFDCPKCKKHIHFNRLEY